MDQYLLQREWMGRLTVKMLRHLLLIYNSNQRYQMYQIKGYKTAEFKNGKPLSCAFGCLFYPKGENAPTPNFL